MLTLKPEGFSEPQQRPAVTRRPSEGSAVVDGSEAALTIYRWGMHQTQSL